VKSGGPWKRTIPLARGGPLRRTPFRTSLAVRKPNRPGPAVPIDVRRALKARAHGLCEVRLPGCGVTGIDPSHRITTKAGGRHGAAKVWHDRLSDVTYSCRPCHRWITDQTEDAYLLGLALKEWQNSAEWPVLLLLHDTLPVFLADDGAWCRFEEGP
jgi:hypothetical protein